MWWIRRKIYNVFCQFIGIGKHVVILFILWFRLSVLVSVSLTKTKCLLSNLSRRFQKLFYGKFETIEKKIDTMFNVKPHWISKAFFECDWDAFNTVFPTDLLLFVLFFYFFRFSAFFEKCIFYALLKPEHKETIDSITWTFYNTLDGLNLHTVVVSTANCTLQSVVGRALCHLYVVRVWCKISSILCKGDIDLLQFALQVAHG